VNDKDETLVRVYDFARIKYNALYQLSPCFVNANVHTTTHFINLCQIFAPGTENLKRLLWIPKKMVGFIVY